MNVLIVGGCGYVGGYMTDLLVREGYDVVVYDNLMYESRYLKDVEFINGDVRDRDLLKGLLPNFDVVIWLAAVVGDGACAVDRWLTQAVNEDAVKWLVQNYKGKIIYPSTCSVYGINNELIDEDAAPNPLSWYAETKLRAEQYIVVNHENHLVFRLGTLFGVSDEHSRVRLDLVANVLTLRASQGQKLIVCGGEQWRPLLHVKDVATAVIHGLRGQHTGLFNLAMDNWTIKQLAEEIRGVFEDLPGAKTVAIEYTNLKTEDQRNYQVNTDRWLRFGWRPQHCLCGGIQELRSIFIQKRLRNVNDPVYSNAGYLNENYWKIGTN